MNETVSKMENVGDAISRQSATTIPVMPKEHRHYQTQNLDDAYEQGWNDLQECIENLPSAQPTQEIIHCKDCRFWKKYKYFNGKPTYAPFCGFNSIFTDDNDFCSRAERRGET